MSINVGIIGTGNMGGAIIKGLWMGEAYKIFAYDSNLNITEQLQGVFNKYNVFNSRSYHRM